MMEPLISIQIQEFRPSFRPGELLTVDYQIDAVAKGDLQAVEASVLWYTEGKGGEDLGVHYFERRVPGDAEDRDLRSWRRFQLNLPNSPMTYEGFLLKIRWCVRIRVFLKHGKQVVSEHPFVLGEVANI
ncbi:MAG: hypothetical protein KDA87_14125 [Planctomycetales bacterium]|nr:hypothetical protein [Planctomycetales bacterium]